MESYTVFSIPPVAKETEAYRNYELPVSHSGEIVAC